jgi:hypothetical protein
METKKFAFSFILLLATTFSAKSQKVFSLEAPVSFAGTIIFVPAELQESFTSKFAPGYSIGVGVKYNVKKYMALRGGVQYWNKPFNIKYIGYFDGGSGNLFFVDVEERGNIRYLGIYAHFLLDRRKIFLGGGPEFSVWNRYRGSWKVFDHLNGQLLHHEKNATESTLNDKFIQQLDLVVTFGMKIWLKDVAVIKPNIALCSPILPLYFSEQKNSAGQAVNLSAFSVRLGVTFELILRGDVQQVKSKRGKTEIKSKELKNIYELER